MQILSDEPDVIHCLVAGIAACLFGLLMRTHQSQFAAGCKCGEQVQRLRMQQQLVDEKYAHYNEWTGNWELRSFADIAQSQLITGTVKK